MKFLSKNEAHPVRLEYGLRRGNEYLERGDYQRAHLAAIVLSKFLPNRPEGFVFLGRVNDRKALVLSEPEFYLDSKANYEQALKLDPANAEAKRRLEEIAALGISKDDYPGWMDKRLGTQSVTFKDCQVGYHPQGVKSIVIWTLADYPEGSFRVVDALTGAVEYEAKLEDHGRYAWNRHHWVAEFSDASRPAEYRLEVSFRDGPGAASHSFPIHENVYQKCLRLSLQGYFNHRCGQDLEWREGCNEGPVRFLDKAGDYLYESHEDGIEELPTPLNIRHGWHDGGNWERHATNMVTNLFCLLLGHDLAPRDWHLLGEEAPDALVEARWAVDYYLSCLDEFGTAQVSTHVAAVAKADDGSYFLTKLYVSHKDLDKIHLATVHKGRSTWIPWYPRLYAAALAKFALLYRPYDPELADRCRSAAVKLQAFHRELDPGETFTPSVTASICLADTYLWKLTGDEAYRTRAREAVRKLLAHHDPDGFFPVEGIEERALYLAGFYPQIALFEFARVFSDDPLRPEILRAYERFMPWIERLSSVSPFRHVMEYAKTNPRNLVTGIGGHGPISYFGTVAIVCLLANRLLDTNRYTPIAERQVQWVFGRNPVGICFMGAAGYRNASQHLMDLFDHGMEFRQVPGYVPLGVRGVEIKGLAPDYPFFCTWDVDGAGQGFSVYWTTCEGGGMTEGPVNAALALLAQAME
jgi:hypothetical protein